MVLTTAIQALSHITSNSRVFIHSVAAAPQSLIEAMMHYSNALRNVEIIQLHTEGPAPYAEPGMEQSFKVNAFFVGSNIREAVNAGRAEYMPIFLSEVPMLFRRGLMPVDCALIQVSPPDAHGFCSLGISVDIAKAVLEHSTTIIAQINKHMPRTHGDGFIHIDNINYGVIHNQALPEYHGPPLTEVHSKIGNHVASLIEDGATLQMGIGAIPDAVLSSLSNHKHLGIHTEMFSDGLIPLIENSGVGGQMDFMRGASLSHGGKPIIALPSVTGSGESKIVSILKPGAGVVTTRAHAHYIVTEYGIANMFGKNIKQRCKALIDIAHPDHREQLERDAKKL